MYDPGFDWDEANRLLEEASAASPPAAAAEGPCVVRLEKQAEWQAHDGQVNVAILENCGEVQRAYTGCWDLASLRCWELGEVLPRPLGELRVGGFLNAVAKLDQDTALVAVSAGLIPTPGESLKVYDLSAPLASSQKAQSCFLHTRGCRALAVSGELAASISKDSLAVSRVSPSGGGLQSPPAFSAGSPHDLQEVTALSWQLDGFLTSGGTGGRVKAWDPAAGGGALWSCSVSHGSWVRHLAPYETRSLVVCHSDGLSWVDARTGEVEEQVGGLGQAYASARITEHLLIVACGRQLKAFDRRCCTLQGRLAAELEATPLSLQRCDSGGRTRLLVGSRDGRAQLYAVHA